MCAVSFSIKYEFPAPGIARLYSQPIFFSSANLDRFKCMSGSIATWTMSLVDVCMFLIKPYMVLPHSSVFQMIEIVDSWVFTSTLKPLEL